jgi:hypothetical protein
MPTQNFLKALLGALVIVFAPMAFAGPPLPVNPGLIDAMRPAQSRAPEELSLAALEDRLRETRAINPWKKLELKGEIDDLLAHFRSAHASGSQDVARLREPYTRLLAKIQGLLKKDPQLARDITASREAIWGVLADRTQFASLN